MVAASALDYRPNQVARALISERSGLVGLVMPPDFIPLYSLALGEFARRLPTAGLQPLVLTAEASTRADDLVEKFIEYRVDGVILTAATLSSRVAARCAQRGIAVIQFGRAELRARGARVSSDNLGGGQTAARLLRGCGARQAAYLGGDPDTSTDRDRAAGFTREWPRAPKVSAGKFAYAEGAAAARTLLRLKPHPDAVFCASDVLAYALLDVARHEFGLSIPRSLMVIGVDDAPPSAWQGYALSTMRQDVPNLVAQTVDLLIERIANAGARARGHRRHDAGIARHHAAARCRRPGARNRAGLTKKILLEQARWPKTAFSPPTSAACRGRRKWWTSCSPKTTAA